MIFDDISALVTKGVSMYMGKRRTIKEVVFDNNYGKINILHFLWTGA